MKSQLLEHIDAMIEKFKKEHKGETPLYVVVSTDENKELIEEIRKEKSYPPEMLVTTYRDIKIAQHPSLLNGKSYVTNELPETGS
jgi:hypothetical protein